MPKRKRLNTKQEDLQPPDENIEDLEWKVVVTKKRKSDKGDTGLEEFLQLGKDLGYNVYLNGSKGVWENMRVYKRFISMPVLK